MPTWWPTPRHVISTPPSTRRQPPEPSCHREYTTESSTPPPPLPTNFDSFPILTPAHRHRRAVRTIPRASCICHRTGGESEARGVDPTASADHVERGSTPLAEEAEANHRTAPPLGKPQHRGRAPTLRRGAPIDPKAFPTTGRFRSGGRVEGRPPPFLGAGALYRKVFPLGGPRPRGRIRSIRQIAS